MKTRAALTATLAAILTTLPATAAEASHGCRSSGAQIVVQTKHGVVFQKKRRGATFTYGCLFSVRRIRRLPDSPTEKPEPIFAEAIQLDGRYVGFRKVFTEPAGFGLSKIVVFDLRTAKTKVDAFATTRTDPDGTGVTSFVIKKNGSVAWIGVAGGVAGPTYEVHKVADGEGGAKQLLDSGPDISRESLAKSYDGLTVYWTKGGQARSAPLR